VQAKEQGGGCVENVILLLYVKDVDYGKRLLRFLAGKKNPRLHPELVTTKSSVEYRIVTEGEELVVLTDFGGIRENEQRKVIYLANKQDREKREIFQFQKAEEIYRELLWQLQLQPMEKPGTEKRTEVAEDGVYCVLAPGGEGATMFSVMLCQYLGNQGNCLYLCLSGFPVFYEGELQSRPDFGRVGMDELLFSSGQKDFEEKEKNLRCPFGKGWMLPPMPHFKDLLDCKPEDWSHFLELLQQCGYDSIVVEMGQLYEHTLEVLELANRVLIVQEEGIFGQIRSAVLERYCELENKRDLKEKMQMIRTSGELKEWERELEKGNLEELAENSQKMSYIEQILKEGGEENVCILEEDG
jgi:hypothetical protein